MPKIEEEIALSTRIVEPARYKVILHNDDYTPMDFVVNILMTIFHKSVAQAEHIMFTVHKNGKAVCGIYSYEIAQTKAHQVKLLARKEGFPLLATLEEE